MLKDYSKSILIQARLGSKRLKKKIFLKINSKTILDYMISQLKKIENEFPIIIITTHKKIDDEIINYCRKNNISYFRGNEKNVLKRYYDASTKYKVKSIVRLTSDCPLVDPDTISNLYKIFQKNNLDYITTDSSFPDGNDVEIMNFKSLSKIYNSAKLNYQKEHPTQYIHDNIQLFKMKKVSCMNNYNHLRYTLDEYEDYLLLDKLINELILNNKIQPFKLSDIIEIIEKKKMNSINSNIIRNEGLLISKHNEK